MATKKPLPKKKVLEDEYTPIFETVTSVTETKYDLNWISVRRKIQKLNIAKILKEYRFGKSYSEIKEPKKESYLKNLWIKYEIWFNKVVNKNVE